MGILAERRHAWLCIFLIIFCFFFLSGCSMLMYDHNLDAETDANQWAKLNQARRFEQNIQFKGETVSFTTKYCYNLTSNLIAIGPPPVPFIPLVFDWNRERSYGFELEVKIENAGEDVSIDVQQIRLVKAGNSPVPIRRASYCVADDSRFYHCDYKKGDRKTITTSPVILSKGTFILSLLYPKIGSPEELTLDLGKITSGGRQISIPPLKYRRSSNFAYAPFFFSGHEPVFRP